MGMPVGGIVRIAINGNIFAQKMITNFWYRVRTASANPNILNELNDLVSFFKVNAAGPYTSYKNCIPQDWVGETIDGQYFAPGLSVARKNDISADNGGRGATTSTNLASVVTKSTELGGRSQIGSFHLPGVATDDQVAGELILGLKTALGTFGSKALNVLTEPFGGGVYEPVIVHIPVDPLNPDKKLPRLSTATLMTGTSVQETIRVMRRRTVGVGR